MQLRPYQLDYVNGIQVSKSNLVVSTMRSGKSVIIKGIIDKYFPTSKVLIITGIRHVITQLASYYDDYTYILSGHEYDHTKLINLATFQTFTRRTNDLSEYDAVFVDEVHMRFNTPIMKQIRTLSCTRIYFTGTPLTNRNTFLSDEFDNVLEFTNIKQMIDDGYLAPTKFHILGNMLKDEASMQVRNGDYVNEDIDQIIDKSALIQWLITDDSKYHWSTQHKTIMYTNSIATTERIVEQFNSPNVRAIHSKLTTKQLDEVREWFESTPNGIIINCRMLTVGVDIPSADTIVYLLPTKIHSLFLQSIFRASTKSGDKVASVYDYSGMLNRVNPYDNNWGKAKKSCREQCDEQYSTNPMEHYFCLEGCKGEPILVTCNGKLPYSHESNPFISNFQVTSGQPCMQSRPSWEFNFKQTDNGIGSITKWSKCTCGCVTRYDVQTLYAPSDMIPVYDDSINRNTVTIIYSAEHRKALALFDDPTKPRYKVLMFDSSEELYTQACTFFKSNPFQIIANRAMPKLPNVAVNRELDAAIDLISWNSANQGFVKKLVKMKLSHIADYFGFKPGYVYYVARAITADNEKAILTHLSNTTFERNDFIKYCKRLQNSIKD